jgi:tRNA (guanine37-N1)-methyltransferase
VLLSGHHEEIAKWRKKMSLITTYEKRPDLLEKKDLTEEELLIVKSVKEK